MKLPFEIYMRQPMRTSRVAEAAMRAADLARLKHPDDLQHLLSSIYWAVETTSPEGAAASTDLLRNKRLAVRSCSQLVTALKVVNEPVAPQVGAALGFWVLAVVRPSAASCHTVMMTVISLRFVAA